MAAIDNTLWQKAQAYASRHGITFGQRLGFGNHGIVLVAERQADSARTAVKIHKELEPYRRERDAYQRLAQLLVFDICGFHVPQLITSDESLWVLEMTVVTRPYVLDFAGAYLDYPPDFPENIWQEWECEKREQFANQWEVVQQVLASLRTYGIFLMDVTPSNIAFLDESDC